MGSGTTGEASLKNQRRFIGIELEPTYFETIQKNCSKWENQQRLF
jgi:DNA modification methylase